MQLNVKDRFGNPFDLKQGVPDELLRLSLNDELKKMLNESADFKLALREAQQRHMMELKENSLKVFDNEGNKRRASKEKTVGRSLYDGRIDQTSDKQPKGTPIINNNNVKKGDR